MLQRLCPSRHPAAPLALIATAHGFFHRDQTDQLAPYRPTAEFDGLQAFLGAPPGAASPVPPAGGSDPARRFREAYAFAVACRQRRAAAAFLAELERLRRATDPAARMALVGLCHGVFAAAYDDDQAAEALAALLEIL